MSSPTTTDYYRQFGYGQSAIVPLRSPVAPAPIPQTQSTFFPLARPQAMQVPAQTQQYIPPGYPPPVKYGDYGWLQDPLHYAMAASPSPMRPQMPGETFVERATKNAGLAMAEAFFMQAVLAVRQLVLAPKAPVQQMRQEVPVPHGPLVQLQFERPK